MANGAPQQGGPPRGIPLSRVHIRNNMQSRVEKHFDFPYAKYLGNRDFFDQLSNILDQMLNEGTVRLPTGQVVPTDSPGGMMAIQHVMTLLEANRVAIDGLAGLGLNIEKQIWKNL